MNKSLPKQAPEQTTKELLQQGFEKYRSELELGDHREIAKRSKESLRNVREYISNLNVSSTDTGLKILTAMQAVIMERRAAVIKAVA